MQEFCISLQIFSDKSEQRGAELSQLESQMNKDVIVLAHTKMKVKQSLKDNDELEAKVAEQTRDVDEASTVENEI